MTGDQLPDRWDSAPWRASTAGPYVVRRRATAEDDLGEILHAFLAYEHAPLADQPTYRAELIAKAREVHARRSVENDEQHVCPSSGDPCPCTPGSTSEAYCRAEVATAGQEQSG